MIIVQFLAYAREQLKDYNVFLSADVFGVIATSWGDSDRIGQTWEEMSPHTDYICPMVYPSHYGRGYFGFTVPDAHPGATVEYALSDALKRNATLPQPAVVRPWLQSFTASSWLAGAIVYGPAEIRQQIEAAQSMGIDEYLLWNANNRYQQESLLAAGEKDPALEKYYKDEAAGRDCLGRTPREALEAFLEAVRSRNWQEAFALQITDYTMNHRSYPQWKDNWTARPTFFAFEPTKEPPEINENHLYINLELHISIGENEYELVEERWEVRKENCLWRVRPSEAFLKLMTYNPEH